MEIIINPEILTEAIKSIKKLKTEEIIGPDDITNIAKVLSAMHKKLYGKEKLIFVMDHSDDSDRTPVQKCTIIEQPKEEKEEKIPEKFDLNSIKSNRKKMTARDFILEKLVGNPMETEELAKEYIKEGFSKNPIGAVKALMSSAISILRKEGVPITKIKAGRYAIKKGEINV